MATVVNGTSCLFWLDAWNGFSLCNNMPELFSFVKNKYSAVQQVCPSAELHDIFHLPLSEEAFIQFTELSYLVQSLQLQDGSDRWSYIWNSDKFTSKQAYKHLIGTRHVHPTFGWLWNLCCQNKRKFFF